MHGTVHPYFYDEYNDVTGPMHLSTTISPVKNKDISKNKDQSDPTYMNKSKRDLFTSHEKRKTCFSMLKRLFCCGCCYIKKSKSKSNFNANTKIKPKSSTVIKVKPKAKFMTKNSLKFDQI